MTAALPAELPDGFEAARGTLQRVATHVLARRRHTVCGRFGLRATPGGIGTPACGPDHEVTRIAGTRLIHEHTGDSARTVSLDLTTASLADAAALVGVDLDLPFEAGHDTPSLGEVATPLALDPDGADALADWFGFAWTVLDATLAALGDDAAPSVIQLWPEHFDAACDVAVGPGRRANIGASPGDTFNPEPYLYVGPWDRERPGDPAYWNAPFGAVAAYNNLLRAEDPAGAARAFLLRGVGLLRAAPAPISARR